LGFSGDAMGFPQTLSGLIGFIIFVAFFTAIVLPNLHSSEAEHVQTLQKDFTANLNNTITSNQTSTQMGFWGIIGTATGTSGLIDFIVGFIQMIISFIQLAIAYLAIFASGIIGLPPIFVLLIALFTSGLIIQVIKLIFLSGD
jgi:hypothetical protein